MEVICGPLRPLCGARFRRTVGPPLPLIVALTLARRAAIGLRMSLRPRTLSSGFIAPCLPTAAPSAPSGDQWPHEIKYDGIRVIARKEDKRSCTAGQVTTSPSLPAHRRGPRRLRSRSCILDGEAVACREDGIALFKRIRYRRHDRTVFLWAFDIIELDGDDLRREPLEAAQGHAGAAPCSRRVRRAAQ